MRFAIMGYTLDMTRIMRCTLIGIVTAASDIPAFGCMAIPTPAACTVKLTKTRHSQWTFQKENIRALVKRIHSDRTLHIDDVAALATGQPGVKTNIDLIEDVRLRRQAMDRTPLAYARRFEALHDRLDKKQWDAGARLWSDYIARSADLWERTDADQYCGLQEEGKSLALDSGYIFLWPYFFAELGKGDDTGRTLAAGVTAGPLITAAGVVSLGADVLTFIPNVAASAGGRLRANIHLKRSVHAFRKFAEYVTALDKSTS